MVKKQAGKLPKKRVRNDEAVGKTRVDLRFDTAVYDRIKKLADEAGISVNQLMHGLARWASEKLMVGEPTRDADGYICNNSKQLGCLWAGETFGTVPYTKREIREICEEGNPWAEEEIEGGKRDKNNKGQILVFLDFTERHVVRDEY